jgi:hypothetical protein
MSAAIIIVAIFTMTTLDFLPRANHVPSFVFLQKHVSTQPCGGLLQTGQGGLPSLVKEVWRVGESLLLSGWPKVRGGRINEQGPLEDAGGGNIIPMGIMAKKKGELKPRALWPQE